MNPETLTALRELAAKLDTTSEYLWGVLIQQAPLSAATDMALFWLLPFLFWYAGYRLLKLRWAEEEEFDRKKAEAEAKDEYRRYYPSSYDGGGLDMLIISTVCIAVALHFIGLLVSASIVAGFFNPEYWALKEILNAL